MLTGVVREWHREDGWGVIDCDATPGGCWVIFSAVEAEGYRELRSGDSVTFTAEAAGQDGYLYRALQVWPPGIEPDTVTRTTMGPTPGYRSVLTVQFDDDGTHRPLPTEIDEARRPLDR